MHLYFFRNAYLEVLKKLGWTRVASLTQDGHKYSEYISHLQDLVTKSKMIFILKQEWIANHNFKSVLSFYLITLCCVFRVEIHNNSVQKVPQLSHFSLLKATVQYSSLQ